MAHRESWQSTQVESYISQAQQALASGNYQTAMNYAQQAQTLAQQRVSVGDHGDRGAAYWNERASTAGSILSQASSSLQTQQVIPVPATVPAPVPSPISPQETAIQTEILALLQGQRQDMARLQPLLLYSLKLTKDPNGTIRKMTEGEYINTLTPAERKDYENYNLALERNQRALKGELPVSVASTLRKQEEFKQFKESMARVGNEIGGDTPSTATSETTPGIQALSEFNKRWGVIEEAERGGELDTGTSQLLQRAGVASNIGLQERAGLLDIPGAYNKVISGYQEAMQPYQYHAGLGTQRYLGNLGAETQRYTAGLTTSGRLAEQHLAGQYGPYGKYAQRASLFSGLGDLAGKIGGSLITTLLSAKKYKKNIRKQSEGTEEDVLDMVRDTDTYTYRYKDENGNAPKRMGLLVDKAPSTITTPDRNGLDVGRTLGLLFVTTKALAKKVNKLEGRKGGYHV